MSLPPCPPPERLASLAEGRAPFDEREALLAHVGACADCHEVFTETADLLGPRDRAPTVGAPSWPAARGPRPVPGLALAASALLAAGLVWQWSSREPAAARRPGQHESAAVRPVGPTPAPPSAVLLASATPKATPGSPPTRASEALPPWIARAPWNGPSARLGFAPQEAERRELQLGFHLAALEAACGVADGAGRHRALEAIERSLARQELLPPGEIARRVEAATSGPCSAPALVGVEETGWRGLGRMLEHWRIDASDNRPAALSPERGQALLARLDAVAAGAAARRAGAALLASLQAGNGTDFAGLEQDLDELIELLGQ